ncbi:hypothetical protein LTR50_007323 [Elasticomyces elasticus]|nr:hypothetical protein LTR50_007323 [Elasticomyces elasticus]
MTTPTPRPNNTNAAAPSTEKPPSKRPNPSTHSTSSQNDIGSIGLLDVLRVLGGLFLLSGALSYFVTKESVLWGYRPWFTKPKVVARWIRGPLHLTPTQLSLYDGRTPQTPIYLALNGSIYDVSAGARHYGPGGSYHFFAGRDAARAFVTGCFEEDLTPDLRGVEEMFVPVDEEGGEEVGEVGEGGGEGIGGMVGRVRDGVGEEGERRRKRAERKVRREREYRQARKKVAEAIEGWAGMFRGEGGKDYWWVGEVVREEGWLEKLPRRELCEMAKRQRPKRKDGEVDGKGKGGPEVIKGQR